MGDKSPKTQKQASGAETGQGNAAAKQKNDNKAAGQTVKPKR